MGKASLIFSISLVTLLLFNGCLARQQSQPSQDQHQCDIRGISALEASDRIQAEAGYTEFWDSNNQQFQCAGVQLIRHIIRQRGLLLPSYVNAPLLVYIEQGRGIQGVMLPGCPETFQSSQQQSEQGSQGQRFQDQHQKIYHFRQGDVLAIPAGAAHWLYNEGDSELVAVVMLDINNDANQLDQNRRRFFLAGNPQSGQQQPRRQEGKQGEQQRSGNIFNGFDVQVIAEAFNVDRDTARRLQGQDDQRGHIVNVERGLQVIRPPQSREEQEREEEEQGGRQNGLEETVCTTKLRENIDEPSRADFYNPQAGRCTTLNSNKFPILRMLQLSAERGVLHRNAMVAPHWTLNAHNIMYVTRGSVRMQIVNNQGQAVFNDEVRQGQAVVVPQNFAVIKRAGEQGCRWIKFRTNDNAMINTLAGRTSALRAMPVDVIANAYQISREQAQNLKYNREETVLFSPSSRSGRSVA